MENSTVECPKCGYLRRENDMAPTYECPKCGIVYAKYLAKLKDDRDANPSRAPSRVSVVRGDVLPSIFARTLRNPLHQVSSFLRSKCTFSIAILFVLFLSIATALALLIVSDYGRLRWQYWNYVGSLESLNFEKSYEYLSPATKQQVSSSVWRAYWEKGSDLRVTDKFGSVEFSADGTRARVQSRRIFDGAEAILNYQNWIKLNGKWYRDFVHDAPEAVREMKLNHARQVNQTSRPLISLLRTSWSIVRSDTMGRLRVTPETSLAIRNNGSGPITELYVKVDYFDKIDRLIIATVERKVVDETDPPLAPGKDSHLFFFNTSTGFSVPFGAIDGDYAVRLASRIERRLFFRRDRSHEWEALSISHLVSN